MEFDPSDWPDPKDEGRGLSVDVMATDTQTGTAFVAWFNFNTMSWHCEDGIIAHSAFKWKNTKK